MKAHAKLFAFWLPLMVLLTLAGWLVFGALPQMQLTGDLIAWLMELPVTTCYAGGAGGATALTMHWTGINLPNDQRAALIERVLTDGDAAALRILILETTAWLGFLAIWALFFFPHW